jgi:molybdate transport system permease protein
MSRRSIFPAGLVVAALVTGAFLALPLISIFLRIPLGRLVDQLSSKVVTDAIVVSLKTTALAQLLIVAFGTPTAYLLATRRFPGRSLAITLVELPLVLPPAVAGIGLLAAFGRVGLLGSSLSALGIQLPFTQAAVVLAVAFVASPLYIRLAIAVFESVDPALIDASRTLGAGEARTFQRIALPLARGGLAAGAALAFARGLGEFGATIMFAGSFQGVTQTLSLAIYAQFDVQFDTALALGGLLVVVSATLLLLLKARIPWKNFASISPFHFAPSTSS